MHSSNLLRKTAEPPQRVASRCFFEVWVWVGATSPSSFILSPSQPHHHCPALRPGAAGTCSEYIEHDISGEMSKLVWVDVYHLPFQNASVAHPRPAGKLGENRTHRSCCWDTKNTWRKLSWFYGHLRAEKLSSVWHLTEIRLVIWG